MPLAEQMRAFNLMPGPEPWADMCMIAVSALLVPTSRLVYAAPPPGKPDRPTDIEVLGLFYLIAVMSSRE